MKFKVAAIIISLCTLLSSCSVGSAEKSPSESTNNAASSEEEYNKTISSLKEENRLLADKLDALEEKYSKLLDEFKDLQKSTDKNDSDTSEEDDTDAGTVPDEDETVKFTLSEDKKSITGALTPPPSLTIPATIDGKIITSISDKAFMKSELGSVVIEEGIESIGWFAFNSCSLLQSVTIPESISYIGYSAFDYCAPDFKIICHKDSYAHKYAESFGIKCEIIS